MRVRPETQKIGGSVRQTITRVLEVLHIDTGRGSGMLDSGYTLAELEGALERRDEILNFLERKSEMHYEQAKQYFEKARGSENHRKLRFYGRGKQHEVKESLYTDLFENLLMQQLFLTNLVVRGKKQQVWDDPMDELGLEIDISSLNQQAIADALNRSDLNQQETDRVMDEVGVALDVTDDELGMPSLDELREEAYELDGPSGDSGLAESFNDRFDDVIDDELEKLDDGDLESGNGSELSDVGFDDGDDRGER